MNIVYNESFDKNEALKKFTQWVNDEHNKRMMKNRGKLFSLFASDDSITFGENDYMCGFFAGYCAEDYYDYTVRKENYAIFVADCLRVLNEICAERNTVITTKPTGGTAIEYIVSRK